MDFSDFETYGQPMSVKDLGEKAKEYNWNPRIGFKYWARAAETIHHEVRHRRRCHYAVISDC